MGGRFGPIGSSIRFAGPSSTHAPIPSAVHVYHEGMDIAVRDDRPERGAPPGRTHRVYAIEGGPVSFATPRGRRGTVRIGHFGYGHVDAVVSTGEIVAPGQHIGWTWEGGWHVHLSEFVFTTGASLVVNPLRPGGKLQPFVVRSCSRDPRDSLSHARDSRLGATAEHERRPPSARGRAAEPEQRCSAGSTYVFA